MPVWWRFEDVLKTVGGEDHAAISRDLLRGMKAGLIKVTADQVIYSSKQRMVREYSVILPRGTFDDKHTVFSSDKRAMFQPEIDKFFNPRITPPESVLTDAGEDWAVDCFGLAFLGDDILREFGLPEGAYLGAESLSVDNVLADDYSAFEDIEREAGELREGFWSPFVACAWVCSRSEQFTAAAQKFEARELSGKRGEDLGIASAAAWLVVGNLTGERYGVTLSQGLEAVRDAIGAKRLGAGTGERVGFSDRRPIEVYEWGAMRLQFERYGVSPLLGLCAVQWSSADLVAAFPTDAAQDLHKDVAPPAPVVPSIARPPMRLADAPPAVMEWLALAVERRLPVRRAYHDAREKLGSGVLRQQEAQDLLKEAMAGHNLPVSRGRPHGRKTGSIR